MANRILIVDDSTANRQFLEAILCGGYELAQAASGEECLARVADFHPHLVLLDIVMPGIDGFETCRKIKACAQSPLPQVILVSTKDSMPDRLQGYQAGADDYVIKPFDPDELLAKVRIHLRLYDTMAELQRANRRLHEFNAHLESLVEQRTAEVTATRDITVFALAELAESRDPETGQHLERVRNYSRILAEELRLRGPYAGKIDDAYIEDIYRSSPLHDIGKVGIPDAILLYPGRLLPEEFEVMKQHTIIGAESLRKAAKRSCGNFLAMAHEIARHHHERFDGQGYPDGLSGEKIPLAARIVAVVDVFDALTSARVYKHAYAPELAREVIQRENGTHFDPAVVAAFHVCYDRFLSFADHLNAVAAGCEAFPSKECEGARSGSSCR